MLRLSDSSSIVLPTPSSNSEIEDMGQQAHHSRNNNNNNNHKKSNVNSNKTPTTTTTAINKNSSGRNNNNNNSHNTIDNNDSRNSNNDVFYLAVYGWRKKCLFTLILLLMILIIINLSLTLWILKVMEFSGDGMGQLKVIPGGLQLSGQTLVLDVLRASNIRSRLGQPIVIDSSRNFTINTRNIDGFIDNQMFLGHDKVEFYTNTLKVTDTHGTTLFAADRDRVTVGASSLKINGDGGAIFKESIQTPLVRSDAGQDLILESPTRSLEVHASQEIFIQSRAGSVQATALNDIKFHSVAGNIRLDSSDIIIPNLRIAQATGSSNSNGSPSRDHTVHKVYQLCICNNGKLFLASPHSLCMADETNVCR